MVSKAFDRDVEREGLEFAQSLKQKMLPKDILAMYEALEKEHAIVETKISVMRSLFIRVLDDEFQKEESSMPAPMSHIG